MFFKRVVLKRKKTEYHKKLQLLIITELFYLTNLNLLAPIENEQFDFTQFHSLLII